MGGLAKPLFKLIAPFIILGLESNTNSKSVIEWAFEKSQVIENLKEAIIGNYYPVVSLISVLEHGSYCKRLLDKIIDQCRLQTKHSCVALTGFSSSSIADAVVNIRDDILLNRIKQTTQGSSDYRKESSYLSKALLGLQRYMALLCFASYINDSPNTKFETRFSSWFKARTEVWRMVQHMRIKEPQLYFFRPVDDLRSMGSIELQKQGSLGHHRSAGMFEMTGAGAQAGSMALEAEEFILKVSRKERCAQGSHSFFFLAVSNRCSAHLSNDIENRLLATRPYEQEH
jgi:hypothetical protein